MMKVKIHRICKDNPLPFQINAFDAGYDVYASEAVEFTKPNETKLVPLGIIAKAPAGHHFKLFLRSSMAYKRGFRIANSVGIIDHSYCGPNDEIKIMLTGPNPEEMKDTQVPKHGPIATINKGDRIGQLLLEKNIDIEWDEQEERDFAFQSRGGFGSTGK